MFFHNKDWKGGKWIKKNFLSPLSLSTSDAWIADSLKCRSKDGDKRLFDENKAFKHCLEYLKSEISIINPLAVVTLGAPAMRRTLTAMGCSASEVKNIRITQDFGLFSKGTKWPVIISLHWAQQSLKESVFIPVVQKALSMALEIK